MPSFDSNSTNLNGLHVPAGVNVDLIHGKAFGRVLDLHVELRANHNSVDRRLISDDAVRGGDNVALVQDRSTADVLPSLWQPPRGRGVDLQVCEASSGLFRCTGSEQHPLRVGACG